MMNGILTVLRVSWEGYRKCHRFLELDGEQTTGGFLRFRHWPGRSRRPKRRQPISQPNSHPGLSAYCRRRFRRSWSSRTETSLSLEASVLTQVVQCDRAPPRAKKADAFEHPQAFDHAGLPFKELPT